MGQALQIVLVEDNAAVRELLLQALSAVGEVHAYANGPDALLHAQEERPDLIVTDHRMPGMSGLDLLLRVVPSRVPVVIMASRADISGPLAGSGPLVEEFVEKPFFLDEATARIKRVIERVALGKATREGAESTSVRGMLAQMSVIDLLQTVDMGRKDCSLVLIRNGERAEMQFHDGQLVHATLGALVGEAVVYKVVGWTEGAFLIDFERRECPTTVQHSTQSVLLEALRVLDESNRDAEEEPQAEFDESSPAAAEAEPEVSERVEDTESIPGADVFDF